MKRSLLDLQTTPELILKLTDDQFKEAWGDAVKLSKDLDVLKGLFLKDFVRRADARLKIHDPK